MTFASGMVDTSSFANLHSRYPVMVVSLLKSYCWENARGQHAMAGSDEVCVGHGLLIFLLLDQDYWKCRVAIEKNVVHDRSADFRFSALVIESCL